MTQPPNRRQHERVRAPRIQVRVASLERLRALYLEDLSQGGIFIRTEKTLAIGALVEVELVPPDTAPLPLKGVVARAVNDEAAKREKRSGMGIRFEGLEEGAQAALTALIARLREPSPASPPKVLVPPPPPGPDAEARVSALEMELADVKGKLEAYEHLQRQLELDEETSRHLAERLAQDKAELVTRADQEREELNQRLSGLEEELESLRQAQATTEAALDAERKEHENTFGELTALQKKGGASADALEQLKGELKRAKEAAELERQRSARLQVAVDEERSKVEAVRAKEREVRRLLSLVSPGKEPPAPEPEPKAVHQPEPKPEPEKEPEPEPEPEPAPEPPTAVHAPESELPVELEVETDEEPDSVEEPPHEDFDIAFQEPVQVADNLPSPKTGDRSQEILAFAERLRKAGRINRTDRFNSHTPTDPAEIFVFDLLSRVQTLEDLAKWTEGRVSREKLVQIVYEFQTRSLISLD